uniref:Uncharacterized protein n=1 Tax=Clastoptera arizonana TaxID=38151 RepID=A0A1B6DVH9_9HEMI
MKNLLNIFFCVIIICIATITSTEIEKGNDHAKTFLGFMTKYNKKYSSQRELGYRFKVFKDNMKRAEELQKADLGTAKYGVTKFADLTVQEFRDTYLGLDKKYVDGKKSSPLAEIPDVKLPKNFDWREHGAVTPVKNQGSCGSCWTFSVTGNIEGQYAIKYQNLSSFSEQEIVDCDKTDGGCSGGWPSLAYQALDDIGGLVLESDYPYTGVDGSCTFDKSNVVVQVNGSVSLPVDETAIAKWMYANGPVSICLNANDMQLYQGGISHPSSCDKYYIDHAVLLTGFGVKKVNKKKTPYWIIKNSWGTNWGEEGYYRVFRGNGTCGLDLVVSSAIIV